tara:strand:+ start:284 stop:1309 length:1026 start_codon:yes stop_codon:yes gene_type:complete
MQTSSTETMTGPSVLSHDESSIREAAAALTRSGVVAFPTETVYGLGASTLDPTALDAVFRIKGRPQDNPLIAHVLDIEGAKTITTGWDDRCTLLAEAWWPGPLTLVLGRGESVPDQASGGRPTLAVRSPEHPVARALLEAFGSPISAPSANRSGGISPTCAQHIVDDFSGDPEARDLIVLDGGRCRVGIESTVLDMTMDPPRILRPGVLTPEVLEPLIGRIETTAIREQVHSPGTAERHYSPQTSCMLVEEPELIDRLASNECRCVVITSISGRRELVQPPHELILMPLDPAGYAMELYEALRRADAERADLILIETTGEDDPNWLAIRDRLMRAASERLS